MTLCSVPQARSVLDPLFFLISMNNVHCFCDNSVFSPSQMTPSPNILEKIN